ncbi:hypothetical protein N7519_007736 [Penicillium mononematosum]|uniref:uncharacterized protein n=1 Tax=Penicillium mononematosum TaxID=268346 RepID=UPI002549AB07|nr:uncharacterized protein N7519_007736 [Penicillium mononematosum]KAJ6186435.1 hypothetical protein N7519_007736 [Penicillium mononematosum]
MLESTMPFPSAEDDTKTTDISSSSPKSSLPQNPPFEAPLVDENGLRAGFWARRAKQCPWQKAVGPRKRPWEKLYALLALPVQREPALRRERNPSDFDNHVAQKKANIEAQTVGTSVPIDAHCDHCQRANGRFTSCVVAPSLAKTMPECANCHWGGVGHRYKFAKAAQKAGISGDNSRSSSKDTPSNVPETLEDPAPAINNAVYTKVRLQTLVQQPNQLEELVEYHNRLVVRKAEILGAIAAKQMAADRLDEEMEAVEVMINEA